MGGLYLSYYADTAGGASIALCLVGGVPRGRRGRRAAPPRAGLETAVAPAGRAGAAQDDVVGVDREVEAVRERRDRLLEARRR